MAGGTAAIVGGGAILGLGVVAGVGGAVGTAGLISKKNTIMQSAKLLVSVREIFLNDEHECPYCGAEGPSVLMIGSIYTYNFDEEKNYLLMLEK